MSEEATKEKKALELNEEGVRTALEGVIDPELHMNIMELGLVYKVELKDAEEAEQVNVDVEMTLTSPGCPYGPMIMGQVPTVIKKEFKEKVNEVDVNLTFTPPWDPATMASEDVKMELGIW